jgi:hypothetical protein
MKLTGKCKEDFEKWYFDNDKNVYIDLKSFYSLDESMQYGVYVDFFDSVGVHVEVKVKSSFQKFNYGIHDKNEWIVSSAFIKTRQEARTAAIEKANELYNNK